MRKTFVLDTNVLLHNPESINMFEDNIIVLPMAVIEELDKFKTNTDELGRNARQVIRQLDALRQRGSLRSGVDMDNGGTMRIMVGKDLVEETGLTKKFADNKIIGVAYHLHRELRKSDPTATVIFVSKDINCRIKADALGLTVQDFESQKVNFDDLYSGFRKVSLPTAEVNHFYENRKLELKRDELLPNEFVLLQDEVNEKHSAIARHSGNNIVIPLSPASEHCYNIKPRSKEQRMALELLLDPNVKIVTLVGQAGTGKTLLALAAALETVISHSVYDKILVTRPIIPMGKDIGYLPGSKDNKLAHWMQPIFDNLTYLMSGGQNDPDTMNAHRKVEALLEEGDIELEALTYIRGRSIPMQYVIVDESQNLTPHEVKTIVSRAGEGTKMVLTGDPHQIDNPYLDAASNGLSYAVERLKSCGVHGHITLHKSERSDLAAVAAQML